MGVDEKLWLHFIRSFGMSEHIGDACDVVRKLAEIAGLPIPDDYAALDEWADWARERGADRSLWALADEEHESDD